MFDNFLSKADPESMPGYVPNAKDLQAQAAGVKGARIGGLARAANLTATKRKQIAKMAAQARWGNRPKS